jgi:quinol-cytochrome oxidoreductase complex cytochrome b subunit
MFGSILVLFFLPWLDSSKVRSARFRPIFKQFFWIFLTDCLLLGWVGANPPEGSFVVLGRIGTAFYFAYFIIIIPLVARFEKPLPLPSSVVSSVLNEKKGERS